MKKVKVKVNVERNYVAKYSSQINSHKIERDKTKYIRKQKHKEFKLEKIYSL